MTEENFDEKQKSKLQHRAIDIDNEPLTSKSLSTEFSKSLKKSDDAQLVEKPRKKFKKSKVVFTSRFTNDSKVGDSLDRKYGRLTDEEQIELAKVDPHVSAIINTRVSQISAFGCASESMFDKGLRIKEMKPLKADDFPNKDDYQREMERREAIKNHIMKWVLKCGIDDQAALDEIYFGCDKMFKYTNLKEYFQCQTRNLLSTGRMGRQNIRDMAGHLVAFRPLPIETIKPVKPGHTVYISRGNDQVVTDTLDDVDKYNKTKEDFRPIAWVQEVDREQVAFFTEHDMRMSYYQKQSFIDLNGYPLSPIEFALFLLFMHQQSLTYAKNQFTKGMLNKVLIVLSSTDPNIEIGENDLDAFKNQLQNMASRSENSASIPVLAGPITAQVERLDFSPKDLEWLQLEQAVIRALCSAYQIDPREVGFGQLGDTEGIGNSNKDYELVQGEERGLRIIVDILLEDLNLAIWERFPETKDEFQVIALGIGSETREGMIARLQQEQQLTATMNTLLSQSDQNNTMTYGGDVPLNPLFHQNAVRYMHYGKFMETFFGMEGASGRPEFDFLIDPALNQMYQNLKTGGREAMVAQNKAMVAQVSQPMPQPGQQQGQQQGQSQQPLQPVQKSMPIQQAWEQAEPLERSYSIQAQNPSFLSEWIRIHSTPIDSED